MRRRPSPEATEQKPHPVPPLPEGAGDWVSPPPAASATLHDQVAAARVAPLRRDAEAAVYRDRPADDSAAGDPTRFSEGTSLKVVIGRETFSPVRYNTFDVGPLEATVTLRQGESIADAYLRTRVALEQLFVSELDARIKEFTEHLDQVRRRVRDA